MPYTSLARKWHWGREFCKGFQQGRDRVMCILRAILVAVWKMKSGEARMEKTSKRESSTWLLLLMIFKLTM